MDYDPSFIRRFNRVRKGDKSPFDKPGETSAKTRKKKIVDGGKGIKKGEKVDTARAGDSDTTARLWAAVDKVKDMRSHISDEDLEKLQKLKNKRKHQAFKNEINAIYRENYMDPESYQVNEEKVYGKKRR